ncbi:hypothetical protein GUITHDRAFT_155086 [Guillardia theta CCMP2712]|uniref:Uncharacterized protein n=2 Tax=Guillardia theta TaxID=55529 RepID=L1IM60_GUITC|nr:hypothetical protein GUITHDRAFT_155086 [Guillardia theta CCMP2712]EKX36989.1 hypothetical protein GUITHDRAFT_155086 [Guillardia theta CCMP2712]|eukprot:XP_005823969.1 hypothetical protein GUITHDRAFT_155086 [Guillardia theta CCMP2712]
MLASPCGLNAQSSGASGLFSRGVTHHHPMDLKRGAEGMQHPLSSLFSHPSSRHEATQRSASINNLCNMNQEQKSRKASDDVGLLEKSLMHLAGVNGTDLKSFISLLAGSQKLAAQSVEQTSQERRSQLDLSSLLGQRANSAHVLNPVNNFLASPAADIQANGDKLVNNLFQKPKGFAEVVQQAQHQNKAAEQKKRSMPSNPSHNRHPSAGGFSREMFSSLMPFQDKSPPKSKPSAEAPSTPFFKNVLKGSSSSILAGMASMKPQASSAPAAPKPSTIAGEQSGGCWNGNGTAQRLMGNGRPTHEYVLSQSVKPPSPKFSFQIPKSRDHLAVP